MHAERAIPWYRSIRFKLISAAVLVEAVMLSLLLANSYRLVSEALDSQTRSRLTALTPLLTASLAGRVFQRDHSEINAILKQLIGSKLTEIRYIVVFDRDNVVMGSAGPVRPGLLRGTEKPDQSLTTALADMTYDSEVQLSLQGTPVGHVRFGLSIEEMLELRGNVLRQSLFIAAGEILLSLLLLASGGLLITRHIATLLEATRRVAHADYSKPIHIAGKDEIALLADNFNRMANDVQGRIADLAESESRFRAIFDAAADAIFIHDAEDGRLLDVNQRMCEMYGCTREQALSVPFESFSSNIPPYGMAEAQEKLGRAMKEDGPLTFDWQAKRMDGSLFWAEVRLRRARIGSTDRIIALVHDISERMRYQQELEQLAHHDVLTGLPNRVLLTDRLQQAIGHCVRSKRLLAIAYLDLDGFKEANDRYGHEMGDRLLMKVAQRLLDSTRPGDTVSRLGGDEFVLLLNDLRDVAEATSALRRVLEVIAAPYYLDQIAINLTASIGFTVYPMDEADTDTLIRHADQAMYVAKQSGRNRCHMFDAEHDRQEQAYLAARTRIEAALPAREFTLYYQPKVDMLKGEVVGTEALIRWLHPEEGLLSPARFLPMIEDTQFAIPLGEWVISQALAQLQAWHATGMRLGVSVNISARHLLSQTFSARLAAMLRRHPDAPPSSLQIEIVESVALEDMERVSRVIDDCHALGVSFALDDFGTGYSSLAYLKSLRVDVLKVDQGFVRDMLQDEGDRAISESVISLARSFNRAVIAEGVEDVETGCALIDLGCYLAQGYCIARPMPAQDIPSWVSTWQPPTEWIERSTTKGNHLHRHVATVEHRSWIAALEAHFKDRHPPPPMDQHACRFGVWLDHEGRERYGDQPAFRAIEQIHEEVHRHGQRLLTLKNQGRTEEALNGLGELTRLRDTLLQQLESLD